MESGAVHNAQREARYLVEHAKSELSCLGRSPARDLLAALAEAVISRRF